MKNGNILFIYLSLFVVFIEIYTINLKIIEQKLIENRTIEVLLQQSMIESSVIVETVNKFHTYKMENFTFESELGMVYVYFADEIAYIKFEYEDDIFARLHYDLVYDSAYDYELIPEALFPIVDKINS